eukprot:14278349-Ditylum_brightwellii.AAC.1
MFEEHHTTIIPQEYQAYAMLKDIFSTVCKLIDGDVDQISEWKRNFSEGIGTATVKLNVSPDHTLNVSGEFVPCYKGPGSLKKRKVK